jgi:3-deoxy-D-manno-octulosonic-acid transferase
MVRRVLRRLRPSAVVVMETEIWPNLYREAKRAGASLLVLNGRISDKALPRYQRHNWFFQHVLALPDAIWVQSKQDAERYVALGAPSDRVVAAGNLKYDIAPPAAVASDLAAFLHTLNPSKTWVAASTMPPATADDPDEDDVVIDAFQKIAHDGLLLILAPRKPERFALVAEKLTKAGVRFVRRTELTWLTLPGVLLLDSMGELAGVFAHADVVFMGGTLVERGGHNILEAAYFSKPVIAGPHMENFAEIAQEFTDAGALVRIDNSTALADAVLSEHPQVGDRAKALVEAKRGVVDRATQRVLDAIDDGVFAMPRRPWLWPLACLWTLGHRLRLRRTQPMKLSTRVVSIGGLTMGGSGKTPLVAHLAGRLENAAILTRGYRRRRSDAPTVVLRGARGDVAVTGDEAQIFIRRGIAHVGISADRYSLARQMERDLHPSIFLLDDGFQHVQLRRDCDIVLIDAQNPFAGGVFPIGLGREPADGLARAHIAILTRVAASASPRGLERIVRQHNPTAPIFHARTVPEPWTQPTRTVAGFCGIGSPQAFWNTLSDLGLDVRLKTAFDDHHRYSADEIVALARAAANAGAECLVTTEKDEVNLPQGVTWPIPLVVVRIRVEIDNEAELLRLVKGDSA